MNSLETMGIQAKKASKILAQTSTAQKNMLLEGLADLLLKSQKQLLAANQIDVSKSQNAGKNEAFIDRLKLTPERIKNMAFGLRNIASLPDPIGATFESRVLPNGLKLSKKRVPLGVIAVIYESRPNVTIDVAGLGIKTGNAVILRGGSDTLHSNRAIISLIHEAVRRYDLPEEIVQFVDDTDRQKVLELLKLHQYVDMLIPRGSASLHQFCRENSQIPVITGGIGICHLFVDESADLQKSVQVILNAKTQRPTVCNALDTVLVHKQIAQPFLPHLIETLSARGVTFKLDSDSYALLKDRYPNVTSLAQEGDYDTEWLSLILGIKVVENYEEAVRHIEQHSTAHSDGILTNDPENAARFLNEIDSAAVYLNASTRFTDGGEFGLGAEVAISTQRLHARGPMGLQELTTYKWVVQGEYHIRP